MSAGVGRRAGAGALRAAARRRGSGQDTHETPIRFAPPLVITEDEVDWALARIAPALT